MIKETEGKDAAEETAKEKEQDAGQKRETSEEETEPKTGDGQRSGSAFEGIYDRMPDISIRALDRFIGVCVTALIVVVLVGILRANHVF